ncbi:MAG: sigma-70 family RNA polymerase sigma factor [Leptospiraceae bacterium]|nr:sigma-70 family RNA polymerase sigma factor [Leptospiraceae bacterium]
MENEFLKKQLELNRAKILGYLSSKLNIEDAEELTQEVYLRAFRSFNNYDPSKGDFGAWIFAIARNALVRFKSKKFLDEVDLESKPITNNISIEEDFSKKNLLEEIKEVISCLPEPEKGIVIGKYSEGLSLSDLASKYGISTRTVSRKYLEALEILRIEFLKKGIKP